MFNIVMFGSAHTMMWPQAKDATPTAAAEAERWIQDNCNGNWGGTEILQCLKAVWGVPVTSGEHLPNLSVIRPIFACLTRKGSFSDKQLMILADTTNTRTACASGLYILLSSPSWTPPLASGLPQEQVSWLEHRCPDWRRQWF